MSDKIKVTYSTLASPSPKLDELFDGAVERARAGFGQTFPMYINGEERFAEETFAKVSEKARKHAGKNPYALFNQPLTVDEILASPKVFDPLTRFQCCPPTCGAAAAIVCSDDFAKKKGIQNPVLSFDEIGSRTDLALVGTA